jgi:hypothetical protein
MKSSKRKKAEHPQAIRRGDVAVRSSQAPVADAGPFHLHVQIRGSDPDAGDPGEIIEGNYTVAHGRVHVEDAEGRILGSEALRPGVDPASIARAILRRQEPDTFWSPLPARAAPV